ncbi:MAG: tetratricopeptide repeat protein [Glaciecola sp.]|nr:tetratricopeptide repeat protein [Glaciecola sp.]MDG2099716.1 tetratricopeptide repeat protein [Glaciecola sp.]
MAQDNSDTVYAYYEEAVVSFNQEEYETSYIHLKNALDIDPDHLPSKILIGRLLLINNLPEAAITEFEEALLAGADPNIVLVPLIRAYIFVQEFKKATTVSLQNLSRENKFEVYLLQASAYSNTDNTELAFAHYQKAKLLKPENTRLLNSMASLYMSNDVWGKAATLIQESLALDPNNPKTQHLQGTFLLLQDNVDGAIKTFEYAYSKSPGSPIIQRSLASAYLRKGMQKKALTLIERMLKETPDPFTKLLYAQLTNDENNEQANKLYQEVTQTLSLLPEDIRVNRNDITLINALASYFQKNYEQAANDLQRYVKNAPNNINALKLLVDSYIQLEQFLNAVRVLEANNAMVMKELPLTVTLCNLYFELDRGFKCESIIRELRVFMEDQSTLNLLEVRSLNNRGESREALTMFEEFFNNVNYPYLRQLHIELLLQNGLTSRARQVMDSEIKRAAGVIGDLPREIHLLNATVLLQERKLEDAFNEVQTVLKREPNLSSARFLQAQIMYYQNRFDDSIVMLDSINETYSPLEVAKFIAQNKISQNKLEEAYDLINPLFEKNPKNISILEMMMEIFSLKEDYENALWINQKLMKTSFMNTQYLITQANLYLKSNQLENAVTSFAKIANVVKDNPVGLVQLAQLQSEAQLFDDAYENIKRARTMLRGDMTLDMQARILQADILFKNRQYNQAITLARSVVLNAFSRDEKKILRLQAMFIIGEVYRAQAQYQQAADIFVELFNNGLPNQAGAYLYELTTKRLNEDVFTIHAENLLKAQPEQQFVRRLLADFYLQTNQKELAMGHYNRLLESENVTKREQIYNNLANILVDTDLDEADKYVQMAFEINQQDAQIIDTMGWIYFQRSDYLNALRQFRKAYVLDSTEPGIKYHLAYVLYKLGRVDEAKKQLERLFDEHEDFQQQAKAKALLAALKV